MRVTTGLGVLSANERTSPLLAAKMSVVQVSRATHCATAFSLPETIRDIARLNVLAKMAVGREFLTICRVSGFTLPVSISNASVSVSWVSAAAATCLHLRLAV